MNGSLLQLNHVTKRFPGVLALDDVQFDLLPGEVHVIMGENGAGKSTLMKIADGLYRPDEGEILINGHQNDTIKAKERFGYVPEVANLYDNLTVAEHIAFIMKAYRYKDPSYAMELLKIFELEDKKNVLAKELSKGMKQKVSMILGLLYKPDAIMVDEPMIGLDPRAIENTLKLFTRLKEEGAAILLSTHIIDMIDDYYDEAYIMDKGKIKAHVIKDELKDKTLKDIFFEVTEIKENGKPALSL